jgi:CxxC-x17-CxxC domain-containing protein
MKNSNRDNRSGGKGDSRKFRGTDSGTRSYGSRGDNRRFGDRNPGRPLQMHKAICSECGKTCELPFKPTGDKTVFCSNCFGNKANSKRSSRRDSEKSHFQEKRLYSAICTECGNKCEVPFRPTGGKPIYCSNCFRKGDNTGGKNTEQFKEQFERLNAKLDNILKFLAPVVSTEVAREQIAMRKTGVPQPKKVAKQQTKRTVSPKKTIKKKAVAKKTVAKKATRNKKNENQKKAL